MSSSIALLLLPTSNAVTVTTINREVFDGGEYKGRTDNVAPSAGMLGEQIRTYTSSSSPVALTTATVTNIASIALTAGIWDISCVLYFQNSGAGTTCTEFRTAISTSSTTNTGGFGDATILNAVPSAIYTDWCMSIPQYRVELASSQTYYLNARAVFAINTMQAFGRISAVRVA